jgi:hypothetical protein
MEDLIDCPEGSLFRLRAKPFPEFEIVPLDANHPCAWSTPMHSGHEPQKKGRCQPVRQVVSRAQIRHHLIPLHTGSGFPHRSIHEDELFHSLQILDELGLKLVEA